MVKTSIAEERTEATADRRAAAYWQAVAKQDPSAAGVARGNARDAVAAARSEDQAADKQENSAKRGRTARL
jgi:hypothetical protein